jgi:hypothetical protein
MHTFESLDGSEARRLVHEFESVIIKNYCVEDGSLPAAIYIYINLQTNQQRKERLSNGRGLRERWNKKRNKY